MNAALDADGLVVPFAALGRSSLAIAGGKAANLGELTRAGLPVPPGFCLTTRAFALVAAQSALAEVLAELALVPAGDGPRLDALAARAREALLHARVPDAIERACAAAYAALGETTPVAVRSSATAEDLPDASFAGQQDTILNVVGQRAVLEAVRRCWASLFTDRAVAYRVSHGIDHREVKLAVAVQAMVQAAVAGVLFTANPVTGRRREAVIDASPGLGEAVVSGAVNPDHFEVRTPTSEVLVRRLGDKRLAIESIEGGGTRRVQRADASGAACVSDAELAALAQLGARVEAHYGSPQDLEWALDSSRRIFLLQARPITTLYPLPRRAPRDDAELRVYFNFSVAQGVLRPLTPMGISCWRYFTAAVARAAGLAGWDPLEGAPFLDDAAGRIFLDLTPVVRTGIGRRLLTQVLSRMEARSAGAILPLFDDARLAPRPYSRLRLVWKLLRALARTRAPLVILRALRSPRAAVSSCQRASARVFPKLPPQASSTERLGAVFASLRTLEETVFAQLPVVGAAMLAFNLAKALLGSLASEVEHDVVLRALPHNPTTEMDLALFALARGLRAEPALRALVRETPPSELSRRFRERTLPEPLQRGLDEFLALHGARGVAEIDVGVARWAEDPAHLLGSLANYLALEDGVISPDAQFARARAQAEAMQEELVRRARTKGFLRGKLVAFCLDRARALAGLREAPKLQLVRALAHARGLLFEIGAELAASGRLDTAAGIFFLTLPEVQEALAGRDVRAETRARAKDHEREIGRRHLPRFLLSDGTEPEARAAALAGDLSGTPASAGSVVGTVRVILDPVGARLEPGEILVAPSTDPGWTPLFLTAGGLVMEMGGAMSHGAVVAREYGIPAVVGVAHATERLRSGQRLRIDGSTGALELVAAGGGDLSTRNQS